MNNTITNETIAQEMARIGWQPRQQPQQFNPVDMLEQPQSQSINRTFGWGESGEIEMRPMEDVVKSSWVKQPQAQQAIETDPEKILEQQREDALKNLDSSVKTARSEITRNSEYRLQTLTREHEIKKSALEEKYGRHNIHVDPEIKKKYEQELLNLNTQFTLGAERISGKIQPDLDVLETQTQQAINNLNRDFEQKQLKIQTIRSLVAKGVIQNPDAALQEQYQILGFSVPLSAFQQQAQTPRQQLNDVNAALRALKGQVATRTMYDPVTEEMIQAGQAPAGVKEQIAELEEMQRQLIPQVYPQYISDPNKIKPLSRAVDRIALVGDGQFGGTLAGRVAAAKDKQNKLDANTARQILNEAGGDKDLARQIAASRGYSL